MVDHEIDQNGSNVVLLHLLFELFSISVCAMEICGVGPNWTAKKMYYTKVPRYVSGPSTNSHARLSKNHK